MLQNVKFWTHPEQSPLASGAQASEGTVRFLGEKHSRECQCIPWVFDQKVLKALLGLRPKLCHCPPCLNHTGCCCSIKPQPMRVTRPEKLVAGIVHVNHQFHQSLQLGIQ